MIVRLLVLFISVVGSVNAQELGMGVPAFDSRVNIFDDSWAARLLRKGTTQSLVQSDGVRFELDLSDRLQVNESASEWRFRISPSGLFAFGGAVHGADVVSSLARCHELLSGWEVSLIDASVQEEGEWVLLRNISSPPEESRDLPHRLARCPILEAASSQIFGRDLGSGSSFIGSGAFSVQTFGTGRSIVLERSPSRLAGVAASATISIRGLDGWEQGLVALRSGTLDMLFGPSEDIVSRARADETLAVSQCHGEPVVHRKRLVFSCMDLGAIRYVG